MSNNNQMSVDFRKVLTGKDGQVFVALDGGENLFLGEADTFQAQLNASNTDLQPVGSILSYAIPVNYTVNITMSEVVIRDDVMLEPLIASIQKGVMPYFNISGKLNRQYDSLESRMVFRYCIPDGSIDLMNIAPGDIIKRAWTFRVNAIPEIVNLFK